MRRDPEVDTMTGSTTTFFTAYLVMALAISYNARVEKSQSVKCVRIVMSQLVKCVRIEEAHWGFSWSKLN